jgi:hypothetical protein
MSDQYLSVASSSNSAILSEGDPSDIPEEPTDPYSSSYSPTFHNHPENHMVLA